MPQIIFNKDLHSVIKNMAYHVLINIPQSSYMVIHIEEKYLFDYFLKTDLTKEKSEKRTIINMRIYKKF